MSVLVTTMFLYCTCRSPAACRTWNTNTTMYPWNKGYFHRTRYNWLHIHLNTKTLSHRVSALHSWQQVDSQNDKHLTQWSLYSVNNNQSYRCVFVVCIYSYAQLSSFMITEVTNLFYLFLFISHIINLWQCNYRHVSLALILHPTAKKKKKYDLFIKQHWFTLFTLFPLLATILHSFLQAVCALRFHLSTRKHFSNENFSHKNQHVISTKMLTNPDSYEWGCGYHFTGQ